MRKDAKIVYLQQIPQVQILLNYLLCAVCAFYDLLYLYVLGSDAE